MSCSTLLLFLVCLCISEPMQIRLQSLSKATRFSPWSAEMKIVEQDVEEGFLTRSRSGQAHFFQRSLELSFLQKKRRWRGTNSDNLWLKKSCQTRPIPSNALQSSASREKYEMKAQRRLRA